MVSVAFLQSMHYSVWFGWIPQEDVRADGALFFQTSVRSMAHDFSRIGIAAVIVLAGGFVVSAWFALTGTRELHLSLAAFRGYLEIAILANFLSSCGVRAERARLAETSVRMIAP